MKSISVAVDPLACSLPHFHEWFGVWAIAEAHCESMLAMLAGTDWMRHAAEWEAKEQERAIQAASGAGSGSRSWYYRQDSNGVAVINLQGSLQKQRASMGSATSTVIARRELRDAVADESIGAVLLSIDSPGGTSAGTAELAEDIMRARQRKPVHAHITDLGASAAYWIASQAQYVTANAAGLVGSIGTYAVVADYSAAAAKDGVKVHVVRAGKHKGAGVMGAEVTAEQLAEMQSLVDSRNEFFLNAVASARAMTMDRVRELADGRVHAARRAVELGLIDGVSDFDAAFASAAEAAEKTLSSGKVSGRKGVRMSDSVTVGAIKAACPGASAEFIVSCQERNLSIEQCASEWTAKAVADVTALRQQVAELQAANAELTLAIDKAKADAEAAKLAGKVQTGAAGVDPLKNESGEGKPKASDYWSAVSAYKLESGKSQAEAMNYVNRKHPELRVAMVEQANSGRGSRG